MFDTFTVSKDTKEDTGVHEEWTKAPQAMPNTEKSLLAFIELCLSKGISQ